MKKKKTRMMKKQKVKEADHLTAREWMKLPMHDHARQSEEIDLNERIPFESLLIDDRRWEDTLHEM